MTNKELENIGKQFTEGAIWAVSKWTLIAVLAVSAWTTVFPPDRDATDPPQGERSGLTLRIDHGTGCQYLETKNGALTPRLARDGTQICLPERRSAQKP